MRHRPMTLDEDGVRLGVDHDESALGDSGGDFRREPNYGSTNSGVHDTLAAPRVARVEPSNEGVAGPMGDSSPSRREVRVESGDN